MSCPFFGSLVLGVALLFSVAARSAPNSAEIAEGEVLVRFEPSQTLPQAGQVAGRHGLTLERHFGWLSAHEGQVIGLLRSTNLSTAALLSRLAHEPAIALAEPNYIRRTTAMRPPNDSRFAQLWGLQNTGQLINGLGGSARDDIGFLDAWALARPNTNQIVVGIIDSGIDATHPDLVGNLWTNTGEIAGNGLDDDTNGYADDLHGYDFALHTGLLTDSGEHGTHVAGTVAATGNNSTGVIGVAFQARLMGLKVSTDGTTMKSSAIIEALQYAAMMKGRGVNIVALNASYGGGGYSDTERSAMQAAGSAGIIFCAAAGNDSANNDTTPQYPASYRLPTEIVVAASDQNDALAGFSNYGATTVDLAAPGVNVLSCKPVALPGNFTQVQQSTNLLAANTLTHSGTTPPGGITATIYDCGLGYPADFPPAVANNIAFIQRGTLTFSNKVANAMSVGARAAIIFNNVPGNFNGTLLSAASWIPAVSISQADGQALKAALPLAGTVVNVIDPTQIYQLLDGTSMATPHVSGAVAFAAMNFPTETPALRIQRLLSSVTPVPALAGKTVTGGRLNLGRLVDTDRNGLPDWWEFQYFGHLTGTDPNADPDQDGAGNLAEFIAGTVPTSFNSGLRLSISSGPAASATLQWPSVAGRYYRILAGTNLVLGVNTILQTNIPATPPLNSVIVPAAQGHAVYRLEIEP